MYRRIVLICCLSMLFLACDNEDFDDDFVEINSADLIAEDSELFDLVNRVAKSETDDETIEVTCIDFIYVFTLAIYNENVQIETTHVISSDTQFSEVLAAVEENQFIGLSFPISSTLNDGTVFEINNKDELKSAIDACIEEEQEETIGVCDSLFSEAGCVWEVAIPDPDQFNTYERAVIDAEEDGTLTFYHRGIPYNGTWIFYFIEEELHVNIFLDDNLDSEVFVDDDWNYDWKAEIVDSETFEIETEAEGVIILNQVCSPDPYCTTLDFEACELEAGSETATFVLSEYTECIQLIAAPQATEEAPQEIDYAISYYVTMEDADQSLNEIDATQPYVNTTNPETLFARIDIPSDNTYSVTPFTLNVRVDCED